MILRFLQILTTAILLIAVILSCSGCGDDPVEPVNPPRITEFTAQPTDIMPGDSTLLSYRVVGADSLKLYPDNIRLSPATTGEQWVSPPLPTLYGLVGYNKDGRDSASLNITMSGAVASIEIFDISSERILIDDSLILSWYTERADSIVISENQSRILGSILDSGQVTRSPDSDAEYAAVAYNDIGNDTVTVSARVEVPFAVEAAFGGHFKGAMGNGIQEPDFRFRIVDEAGLPLRKPWLHFSIIEGDGTLSADSVLPDAYGAIWNDYQFDGQLGHGVVRALVRDVDTLDVKVRASVLRLGAGGQGQYITFDDTYADVLALNGSPDLTEPDPYAWRNYALYENDLGVVVAITDVNQNELIEDNEPIDKVIVNTVFSHTTLEGIGIGSTIHEVRAVYDPIYDSADSHFPNTTPPATEAFVYESLGAIFWALASAGADSAIVEIHLWEPVVAGSSVSKIGRKLSDRTALSPAIRWSGRRR